MFKNNVNYLVFYIVFCLGMVLVLSGCGGSAIKEANSDPFNFYNQVQLGQPKSEVDATLSIKPEEKEGTFIYKDDKTGFGVAINYDASNLVSMKTLYHADEKQIMALSHAKVTEDQLTSITKGITYEEVKTILGSDGLEIIRLANPVDPNTPVSTMIWFNDDQTGIYVTFSGEKGTVISAKYWK